MNDGSSDSNYFNNQIYQNSSNNINSLKSRPDNFMNASVNSMRNPANNDKDLFKQIGGEPSFFNSSKDLNPIMGVNRYDSEFYPLGSRSNPDSSFYRDKNVVSDGSFSGQSDREVPSPSGSNFNSNFYGQSGLSNTLSHQSRTISNAQGAFPSREMNSGAFSNINRAGDHANFPRMTNLNTSTSLSNYSAIPSQSSPNRGLLNVNHPTVSVMSRLPPGTGSGYTSPTRNSPNMFQQTKYTQMNGNRCNSPSSLSNLQSFNSSQLAGSGKNYLGLIEQFPSSNSLWPKANDKSNKSLRNSPNLQIGAQTSSVLTSVSSIGSSNSTFNSFPTSAANTSHTALDVDFPALGNKQSQSGMNGPFSRNYVGMVSKISSDVTNEFTIQNEDFPALPGANRSSSINANLDNLVLSTGGSSSSTLTTTGVTSEHTDSKKGINTFTDGRVTNIPKGMVTDQFGIVGLLTFIRAAERDSNLVALALGSDLQNLGLNLTSQENLFSLFQSPWAETPCRPQDIDYFVPSEYLTNIHIRDKLASIKLNRYNEDLLFYLFYTNINDVLQLAAAAELWNQDWRYHKVERMWLTRAPGYTSNKTDLYEHGTYLFFDYKQWRKVPREFRLEYDKLEDRPQLPTTLNYHPAHSQVL